MGIVNGWKLKYKDRPKKPKSGGGKFKAYHSRNDRLSDLGYAGYAEYLASDDWKTIRDRKLRRFPRCLLCERPANQVHHMDYSDAVLLGFVPQLLVTLCDPCHHGIEFDGKEKRGLAGANVELRRLAHERGLHRWLEMAKQAHEGLRRRKGKVLRSPTTEGKKTLAVITAKKRKGHPRFKPKPKDAAHAIVLQVTKGRCVS